MDIAQLRTVLHVAELGSLSRAAERLHIAQPALSRQVRLLEQELGTRLFSRHGRGMQLTEAGQELILHARQIMRELEAIRSLPFGGDDAPLRGEASIGMPPTVAAILAIPLARAFRRAHPQARLRIVSAYSAFLMDWLRRGDLDIAILYETQPLRWLRASPLLEEELFLVGPADSGLDQSVPVAARQLAELPMILSGSRHGMRETVERLVQTAGVAPNVVLEADSLSVLKEMVQSGLGYTVLPASPIREDIGRGSLRIAPLVDPRAGWRLMLTVPVDRRPSRLLDYLERTVVSETAALVHAGTWEGHLPDGN
ncbi:LysR substrate-binding domain-containing protein [Haematobacter missouriensis]|uniref:LysR family transcriptional regulator n=1 Tax=Haematobacter missouriensis TaxID=366616 RepID=A0A212AL83_9RHOB|nr:LysR substrate-binding domain-containing protein [Haematobacter missouriensis]OWJ82241.1 LysR family transcriptional regulator [Haematobacter missouriensis]